MSTPAWQASNGHLHLRGVVGFSHRDKCQPVHSAIGYLSRSRRIVRHVRRLLAGERARLRRMRRSKPTLDRSAARLLVAGMDEARLRSPIILTGRGGSGTRMISDIAKRADVFLGNDLNQSNAHQKCCGRVWGPNAI